VRQQHISLVQCGRVDSVQMSVGEDKENVMKKPSRVPAKSAKVTSDKDIATVRQPLSSHKSRVPRSSSNQALDK